MRPEQARAAFRSLTNDNGHLYQALLEVLADATAESFITELTEGELAERAAQRHTELGELVRLRSHLEQLERDQLVSRRANDLIETVEQLRTRQLFWSLTATGSAVLDALAAVAAATGDTGALRSTTLRTIADDLAWLAAADPERTDPDQLQQRVDDLLDRQGRFATEARTYITRLNATATADADDADVAFELRKQAVRAYLDQFLATLEDLTPQLRRDAATLGDDDASLWRAIVDRAAASGDFDLDAGAAWRERVHDRFTALYDYFVPDRAPASSLYSAARTHVFDLVRQLASLARRTRAAGRTSDRLLDAAAYITAATGHDDGVVRVAQATGLHPATHLQIPVEDPEAEPGTPSWRTMAPVPVPVSLRRYNNRTARGRTGRLPDRSRELAALRATRRRDAEQAATLLAELQLESRFRLSQLEHLGYDQFAVLQRLLTAAFDAHEGDDRIRTGTDHHTGITVRLHPLERPATVAVTVGDHRFTTLDRLVEVTGAPAHTHPQRTSEHGRAR